MNPARCGFFLLDWAERVLAMFAGYSGPCALSCAVCRVPFASEHGLRAHRCRRAA